MTNDTRSTEIELAELMVLADRAVRTLTITELHGAACGVLAGGGGVGDLVGLVGVDALTDSASVTEFWRANGVFAFAEDMRFSPGFAAEDGAGLAARVDDLAQWSASFLAGFMRLSGGNAGLAKLPEETREIVQDLAAIAGAQADSGPSDGQSNSFLEEHQSDYVEPAIDVFDEFSNENESDYVEPAVDGFDEFSNENESDYVELLEFVRVAVLLLISARLPAPGPTNPTDVEPH